MTKKDNGVQWAIKQSIDFKNKSEFTHPELVKKVEIFIRDICDFDKTGDLNKYLITKYLKKKHKNQELFTQVNKESPEFVQAEKMPKYLQEHFPEEINNVTKLEDLKMDQPVHFPLLFAIFGGGNEQEGISYFPDSNLLLIKDMSNKTVHKYLDKWIDEETCDYTWNDVTQKKGSIIKEYDKRKLNELLLLEQNKVKAYIVRWFKPKWYQFKGQVKVVDKEILNNGLTTRVTLKNNIKDIETANIYTQEFDDTKSMTQRSEIKLHERAEGKEINKQIKYRGRSSKIKDVYLEEHGYTCHLCGKKYPKHNNDGFIIDVHHLHPIYKGERTTDPYKDCKDLVGLCPNCHRWVHSIKSNHEMSFEEIVEKFKNRSE